METNQRVMEKLALLKSQLTARKTTTEFVKFPMSSDDAAQYIDAVLRLEVESRGNSFKDSEELQDHIIQIARLFTEPTAKFGILLCGGVGNGKSSMMYALRSLIRSLEIPFKGTTSGGTYFLKVESAKYLSNEIKLDWKNMLTFRDLNMLGIDDLGEEETVIQSYGNRQTPLIDLLSYRYSRMLFTMVTTNLTPTQIRTVYGDRIADRFNEMMLFLPYSNPSFRTHLDNALEK